MTKSTERAADLTRTVDYAAARIAGDLKKNAKAMGVKRETTIRLLRAVAAECTTLADQMENPPCESPT